MNKLKTNLKIIKTEVEGELLFRQEFRWRNNKPVCLKIGDVIEVELDSSKKYAYVKRKNNYRKSKVALK
ncbi:MAG: hypothetical protein LRZ94_00940 [Candidatus Pacebacteria bacterium]|nr:hypothetical protein [Candidatus Paceibacterota bacterium]